MMQSLARRIQQEEAGTRGHTLPRLDGGPLPRMRWPTEDAVSRSMTPTPLPYTLIQSTALELGTRYEAVHIINIQK